MITDVLMAFIVALFLEMLTWINEKFKKLIVVLACLTFILIYFINGCKINFIGEIDFAIWTMFVVVFDALIILATTKLNRKKA